jgi:hypothetical protein
MFCLNYKRLKTNTLDRFRGKKTKTWKVVGAQGKGILFFPGGKSKNKMDNE